MGHWQVLLAHEWAEELKNQVTVQPHTSIHIHIHIYIYIDIHIYITKGGRQPPPAPSPSLDAKGLWSRFGLRRRLRDGWHPRTILPG